MDVSEPCDCGDPDCPSGVPVRHPFGISIDMVSDDFAEAELYLTVRTTSWDFGGERTDLHDAFSLLWAAMLRAREVASGRLVTVLNGFSGIDSEIYARLIRLDQPGTLPSGMRAQAQALSAESFDVGNLITDAFGQPSGNNAGDDIDLEAPEPQWIKNVRRRYRLAEFRDYEVRHRAYCHAHSTEALNNCPACNVAAQQCRNGHSLPGSALLCICRTCGLYLGACRVGFRSRCRGRLYGKCTGRLSRPEFRVGDH